MAFVRITEVQPLEGKKLRLKLSDGTVIERDVTALLKGPIFEPVRKSRDLFQEVRVEGGTVVWPNGADLCPDVLIYNGPPPEEPATARRARYGAPNETGRSSEATAE